jgi:tRNA 2-selenouridine synthase
MTVVSGVIEPDALYPVGAREPPLAIIDVRSPVEVARGALPGAHALPLLSDEERHQVGLCYARSGQEAALALGWEITEAALPARIAAWREVAARRPTAVVCWRGGLRSRLATELIDAPQARPVAGGYKAVRHHLTQALPAAVARVPLLVLTGLTGAGKTDLLEALDDGASSGAFVLDLERLARHRGSSFGATPGHQPAQPTFEHDVASALLLHGSSLVVVEDESRFVGRRTLPPALLDAMRRAPLAVLETTLDDRIARVFEGYVRAPAERDGVAATTAALTEATLRLRRRLGNPRVRSVLDALQRAEAAWFDPAAHHGWIRLLLEDYYDRLYERNRTSLARPVALRGDAASLAAAIRSRALECERSTT